MAGPSPIPGVPPSLRNSRTFSGRPVLMCTPAHQAGPKLASKNSRERNMNHLTRRNLLAGAAAASAATALTPLSSSPASAAAPLATAQAPGWYRYNVGSYQITVATDGKRSFKLPDTFVLNAKKDQVNEALLAAHMEKDMMTIPYSPIVINTGSKLIVVDTGVGEANFERSKGVAGQFQSNLKAAGIDRDKVDTVIISHFHGDHINGLIKP